MAGLSNQDTAIFTDVGAVQIHPFNNEIAVDLGDGAVGVVAVVNIAWSGGNSVIVTPPDGWELMKQASNRMTVGTAFYKRVLTEDTPNIWVFDRPTLSISSVIFIHHEIFLRG